MSKTGKTSIRKEIFNSSMIFSSIILVVFSLFLSNILYRSGMSKAYDIIKHRNYAVNFFIDGYFSEINNTIEILAANEEIQNVPWLGLSARQRVLNLYKSFAEINQNITFIYSGYENKELLINDYTPPKGFNPTVRPWYQSAMAVKPRLSTGLPYQEIKSKKWLFSTSKALFSKEHGYTGVISSDSSIEMVTDLLKQQGDVYKSSYSFVTKPDGEIILHHNASLLKKNISKIIGSPLNLDKNEGRLVYKLDNREKIAFYSRCNETDWLVITVVDKNEIIKPIIWQIFFCIILTGIIAVLLGVGQSAMLSRRFSTPLLELRKKVKTIISGNRKSDSNYKYPENEIGIIAREVGQLTEQELYIRSKELEDANILLEQKNEELKFLSTTDQLTGLYNRHKIDVNLEKECQRSVRYKTKFSVIMFDIDWFKKINDTYGHQAGDSVLKDIALLLKNNLRDIDIPGRWGGEEFLILCPQTDIEDARKLGVRICSLVANHRFTINAQVTISVGVAEFSEQEKSNELIKRADNNLYTAKHQGRNTVISS